MIVSLLISDFHNFFHVHVKLSIRCSKLINNPCYLLSYKRISHAAACEILYCKKPYRDDNMTGYWGRVCMLILHVFFTETCIS